MLMHGLVLAGAERHPERICLRSVDRGTALTYAGAADAISRLAGALAALGVQKGDRVCIFAPNGLEHIVAMFAAFRLGAIAAPIDVRFGATLARYVADDAPKVIVYAREGGEAARGAAAGAALLCIDGPDAGAHALPELMAAGLSPPADPADETATAHLSYDGGGTGVRLAHEPTVRAARCIGERLRIRADDVSFGATTLSSFYPLVANLLPQLAAGATINVSASWSPAEGFAALDTVGATFFVGDAASLQDLLVQSRAEGRAPGRLRFALSSGAVAPSLKKAFRDELRLPLVESCAQAEFGFLALGYPELEPDDAKLARIGPPPPDKELYVLDAEDRPLPHGETGEFCLSGGGGLSRTGVIGFLDADGHVTLRGRRAELVEVGGVAWFPGDIEAALQRIAGVRQAALIGLPDAVLGARPAAYVTLEEGHHLAGGRLKEAIAGEVAYDLAPLTVTVLDDLPMTPAGEIAKAELASARRADS